MTITVERIPDRRGIFRQKGRTILDNVFAIITLAKAKNI